MLLLLLGLAVVAVLVPSSSYDLAKCTMWIRKKYRCSRCWGVFIAVRCW